MSEDKPKKTRINLKDRLGKGAAGGTPAPAGVGFPPGTSDVAGGSVPPAAATPPPPRGIAPPPGISPGIPVPPFAIAKPAAQPAAPKPSAAQQTIKVEVGEEVHAERRKLARRGALFALMGIAVGGAIGFPIGGQKARADRGKQAIEGAGLLEKDVAEAHAKLESMRDKVKAAYDTYAENKFPTDFVKEMADLHIPFDALSLENKRVGDLQPKTQKMIFKLLTNVEDLNKTKDKLRGLLTNAQAPIEKFWKEQKEPVVAYSVVFRTDPKGMLAELVPVKEPFVFGAKEWPASYEIKKIERAGREVKETDKKGNRWVKGDLTANDAPLVFPVDPMSVARFSGEQLIFTVRKNLADLREVLEGSAEDPQNPTKGIVEDAKELDEELKKVAATVVR